MEVEAFCDILQETSDSIPNRDVKVIIGDANAKIGKRLVQVERMVNIREEQN